MSPPQAPSDVETALGGRVGRLVGRNLAVLWPAQALTLLLHLGWFAVLTSHLGASRLGIYVFAVAVPDLLGPLVDFGFSPIAARDVAQVPAREAVLVPNVFYLRLTVSLLAYLVALAVLHAVGYGPLDVRTSTVAALITLVSSAQAFQVSLEVRLRMGWVAAANLIEAVILAGGVVVLAHRHAGVLDFVWLYVGANAINFTLVAARAITLARYRWAPRPPVLRPLLGAALPLGAAGVVTGLYYRLNVFILGRFHSSTALGQFGAGYRFIDTIGAFPGLLLAVLGPVFARSAAGERQVLIRRYQAVMHLALVPGVMVGVGGAMTAWRALPALHAFRHYHGGGVVLAILCPAAGFLLVSSVASGVLFNAHHQKLVLRVAVSVLVFNAAVDFALIPPWSYVGAAAATTSGEAAAAVALVAAIRRRMGLQLRPDRTRQVVLSGTLLAGVLGVGYLLPPLAQLGLGVVTVPAALVVTGALGREDLGFLRRSVPPAQAA